MASQRIHRVPIAYHELQVNCCRNVLCENFGKIPIFVLSGKYKFAKSESYLIIGDKNQAQLQCKLCKAFTRLKSNKGVYEELNRIRGDWLGDQASVMLACPKQGCDATGTDFIIRHGTTKSGSIRYRCKQCGTTFVPSPRKNRKQKKPEISELVFRLLINKMPMRRICETADIQPATLYSKIDLIHRCCINFAYEKERVWRQQPAVDRVYLSLDRQEYIFNWGTQLDRTNTSLTSITSVDNRTGYAFSLTLDFDHTLNADQIEAEAVKINDYDLPYPYRNFARLWMLRDYSDKYILSNRLERHNTLGTSGGETAQKYRDMLNAKNASDTEVVELPSGRRPSQGMQVRSDYALYGHLFFLEEMLRNVSKVRFFMDRETGVFPAFAAAFGPRIIERTADAFFVRMKKSLSVDKKKLLKAAAQTRLNKWVDEHPEFDGQNAVHHVLREILDSAISQGSLNGEWIMHPLSDMAEPNKEVAYLTDLGGYDLDHLAHLYNMASLKGVDRFLMLIRRRLSLFERPIHTANAQNRSWYGYSGYNPAVGAKLLAIFRTAYNYCLPGDDGKTPAMRVGTCDHVVTLGEVLGEFNSKP